MKESAPAEAEPAVRHPADLIVEDSCLPCVAAPHPEAAVELTSGVRNHVIRERQVQVQARGGEGGWAGCARIFLRAGCVDPAWNLRGGAGRARVIAAELNRRPRDVIPTPANK